MNGINTQPSHSAHGDVHIVSTNIYLAGLSTRALTDEALIHDGSPEARSLIQELSDRLHQLEVENEELVKTVKAGQDVGKMLLNKVLRYESSSNDISRSTTFNSSPLHRMDSSEESTERLREMPIMRPSSQYSRAPRKQAGPTSYAVNGVSPTDLGEERDCHRNLHAMGHCVSHGHYSRPGRDPRRRIEECVAELNTAYDHTSAHARDLYQEVCRLRTFEDKAEDWDMMQRDREEEGRWLNRMKHVVGKMSEWLRRNNQQGVEEWDQLQAEFDHDMLYVC